MSYKITNNNLIMDSLLETFTIISHITLNVLVQL